VNRHLASHCPRLFLALVILAVVISTVVCAPEDGGSQRVCGDVLELRRSRLSEELCEIRKKHFGTLVQYILLGSLLTNNFSAFPCVIAETILQCLLVAVKLCMAIGVRPHVCGEILMFTLTPADGLYCVGLYTLFCVGSGVRR
jgi:hypothetical protein